MKYISLLLSIIVICTLVSCTTSTNNNSNAIDATEIAEATEPPTATSADNNTPISMDEQSKSFIASALNVKVNDEAVMSISKKILNYDATGIKEAKLINKNKTEKVLQISTYANKTFKIYLTKKNTVIKIEDCDTGETFD